MKDGLPFRPPAVPIDPAVACALDLAFAPVAERAGVAEGVDPQSVFDAARSMALDARVGQRWGRDRLAAALGPAVADAFVAALRRAGVEELQAAAVAADVARVAADLGIPVLFLKGAALVLDDLIGPGARGLGDVDLLTPEGRERDLQEALKIGGSFEPQDLPHGEHQLQVLGHPLGMAVEIHLCLRGVRSEGGDSFTWGDVDRSGVLRRRSDLPGEAYTPARHLLLAHAVVHGLAQHGLNPKDYPLLRFVADLVDLDLAGSVACGDSEVWLPWVARDVSPRAVTALASMCRCLIDGRGVRSVWEADDDGAVMLRHLVLGSVDIDYRDSLRLRSLTEALPTRGRVRTLARTLWHGTILTRAQIDILYGKPSSQLGYWGYRIYRPFHVVGRAVRYGVAALKGRRRRDAQPPI